MEQPDCGIETCDACGYSYIPWFASNELWNRVVPGRVGKLCPNDFLEKAAEAGVDPTGWEIREEVLVTAPKNDAMRERGDHDKCMHLGGCTCWDQGYAAGAGETRKCAEVRGVRGVSLPSGGTESNTWHSLSSSDDPNSGVLVGHPSEPSTTDYCESCGHSPESAIHMPPLHGQHRYVWPARRPLVEALRAVARTRAGKLLICGDAFFVVKATEPYAQQVAVLIKQEEQRKGTWTEEDRTLFARMLSGLGYPEPMREVIEALRAAEGEKT